jgi:hypothetical protein
MHTISSPPLSSQRLPRTVNLSVPMDNGPNGGHQTPLAFIISRCIAKIISEDAAFELVRCLLVECRVDPNVGIRMNQGSDVEYPIVMVVRHTLIKIFQLLVGHGADMRSRSTLDGKMEDCAAAAISSLIFCTRTSSRAKCMQMLTLVYERSCRSRCTTGNGCACLCESCAEPLQSLDFWEAGSCQIVATGWMSAQDCHGHAPFFDLLSLKFHNLRQGQGRRLLGSLLLRQQERPGGLHAPLARHTVC